MHISYTPIPEWPPLAWLARCRSGNPTVHVLHGPRVEVNPEWFAEAVWADRYSNAAFDRTDLVFGSGGRVRGGTLTFVSAGTTVDRLQLLHRGTETCVSNSLPCLLAAVGGVPDPTHAAYYDFFKSIIRGLPGYQREMPTSAGPARLVYFNNLEWDGRALREVEKPAPRRDFSSFEKYREFLQSSLVLLNENLAATERRFPYRWLGTISSGYDSLATAILAKPAGLTEAISITEARDGETDSGQVAASFLGLALSPIARDAWRQAAPQLEVPFIAADAKGEDVFLGGAEACLVDRALLTGHYGIAWDKNVKGLTGGFERKDQAGLSLTEFRLWAGFLHCPIAYLGARQARDLQALNHTPEMRPWDVGGRYTRPIARRIIETAGIPRGTFAIHKRAGSVLFLHRDSFLSPSSLEDFTGWLRDQSDEWRKRGLVPPIPQPGRRSPGQHAAAAGDRLFQLLARATAHRVRFLEAIERRLANIANQEPLFRYLFPWATARAKERYTPGLRRIG